MEPTTQTPTPNPQPASEPEIPTHPQYRKTATSLSYQRETFSHESGRHPGEFDYYKVKLYREGDVIFFEQSPPVIKTGYVFLGRLTYKITEKDLVKGKFHAPSKEFLLPRVTRVSGEERDIDFMAENYQNALLQEASLVTLR